MSPLTILKPDFLRLIHDPRELNRINLTITDGINWITPENIVSSKQLIDSVHDFGGSRGNNLATDSITLIRGGDNWKANSLLLYFIQKYSFSTIPSFVPPIPLQLFSYLSWPGVGHFSRAVSDVEDYCFLCSIQVKLRKNINYATQFSYIGVSKHDDKSLVNAYDNIAGFFSNCTDPTTTKINLLVDTPGDLSKILRTGRRYDRRDSFAYILLQESAHDSAKGKPSPLEPVILRNTYGENVYVEEPGQSRTYTPGRDREKEFESTFNIKFNGFQRVPDTFRTEVEYNNSGFSRRVFQCTLNSLVHPTNVPQITKDVKRIITGTPMVLVRDDKTMLSRNNINDFYSSDKIPHYNANNQDEINFNFTKKRAGDGLQARVCQLVNSGGSGIKCYKMGGRSGGIWNGCSTDKSFAITKLVLVTIDRVLFSYCVDNDIPAIYSSPSSKFLYLFNPDLPDVSAYGAAARGDGAAARGDGAAAWGYGGSAHYSDRHITSSKPMIYAPLSAKAIRRKKFTGGFLPRDERNAFISFFTEIPFYLYKILPKLLYAKKDNVDYSGIGSLSLIRLAEKLYLMNDDDLVTLYIDQTTPSCLFYLNYKDFNVIDSYLIYLEDPIKHNLDLSVRLAGDNEFQIVSHTYGVNTRFNNLDIANLILDTNWCYFTRTKMDYLRSQFYSRNEDDVEFFNTLFGFDDGEQEGGGDKDNLNTIPLLESYYNVFFVNDISLDENKLELNNLITLVSYFNVFSFYETCLCIDNDEYHQSFKKENGKDVTLKLSLYIMFELLLNDYVNKKGEICYALLEYFLNDGDTERKYFIISDDIERLIYYVYSDYKIFGTSANNRIKELIADGKISETDDIFINTKQYFNELKDRILEKENEIESYLNGETASEEIKKYVNRYLNIYGFMNIVDDWNPIEESVSPTSVSDKIIDKYKTQTPLITPYINTKYNMLKSAPLATSPLASSLSTSSAASSASSAASAAGGSKHHSTKYKNKKMKKTKNNRKIRKNATNRKKKDIRNKRTRRKYKI